MLNLDFPELRHLITAIFQEDFDSFGLQEKHANGLQSQRSKVNVHCLVL